VVTIWKAYGPVVGERTFQYIIILSPSLYVAFDHARGVVARAGFDAEKILRASDAWKRIV
jgi:hypothetical protein